MECDCFSLLFITMLLSMVTPCRPVASLFEVGRGHTNPKRNNQTTKEDNFPKSEKFLFRARARARVCVCVCVC